MFNICKHRPHRSEYFLHWRRLCLLGSMLAAPVVQRSQGCCHLAMFQSTKQLLMSRCADLSSRMWSILLSNDRTLARMMDGMVGRFGFVARLAQIPPRLSLFCFLLHCLRHLLSGEGVAVESGVVTGRRSKPSSLSVSVCTMSKVWCGLVLPMSSRICRLYLFFVVDRRHKHIHFPYKH